MRPASALIVICVAHVVIGLHLGYRDGLAFARFWLITAIVVAAAAVAVSRGFGAASDAEFLARTSVTALAVVVVCGLALGWIGQLSTPAYLAAESALLVAAWRLPRRDHSPAVPPDPLVSQSTWLPAWLAGILGALAAFAAAFAIGHAPLTLYDSVSYHLFFAARWLQDGALSIIPTPFSDPAQAYAPGNGELYFLWLMLPFHGDLLARFGQMPFAALGALALYLLARRLGAEPGRAVYPAAFFLLSRPILEQAVGANVDLICAVLFLTSLYFGLVAVERNQPRDWIFFGVNLGLYLGTKYLALVYAPVFLVLAFTRRPDRRWLWIAAGVALLALPWYIRNWVAGGSPIYPASLTVDGFTLARGAFTRTAMLNTVFHTNDPRLVPAMLARAFGPTLFIVWVPVALVGGWKLARRGWWPHAALVALPLVLLLLFWGGLPVNVDPRFLMPAIAPALLPFAFAFGRSRIWNRVVHAFYAAAAIWILVGTRLELKPSLPWFMDGWWSLEGLVARPFLAWFAALAAAMAALWWIGSRTRWLAPAALAVVAAAAAALAIGADSRCAPARCDYLVTTSPYIRPSLVDAWRWVDGRLTKATIAYSGINLPYPLTGDRLTNRVIYVNTDRHVRWRFHDYDRAYWSGRFAPPNPPLASSSGELLPVADRRGPRDDALRPRYDRMAGSKSEWIGNLEVLGVTHVFVAALSAYEIDHVWHNDRGLPIEDDWAASEPALFVLLYENPQVRLYAVNLPVRKHA